MTEKEVVADYDVRSPASRTLMTVVGTIVTVAIIAGLVLGASILKRNTKVSTSDIDVASAAQIVIDAGATDVRLVQGDPDLVRVTSRITSGLRTTAYEIGRRGDRIKIVSACQSWFNPGCGVTATIEIPPGLPVVVKTSTGDVTADAVAEGVLTVLTGSGDVSGTKLELDELSATTASGDISATFARQPSGFKAVTDSGDISADVPAGKIGYAVTARSDSGEVDTEIESDADGSGFIRATSDSGDIELHER